MRLRILDLIVSQNYTLKSRGTGREPSGPGGLKEPEVQMRSAKKEAEEKESVFRERLAEVPYLYGVQNRWSRNRTEIRMATLDQEIMLRACKPEDHEKLEVFVFHVGKEVLSDRRRRFWRGTPASTAIESIWHFSAEHNLAWHLSVVSWSGEVLDLAIAHRPEMLWGTEHREVHYYDLVEVYRGRSVERVQELIKKCRDLPSQGSLRRITD